MTTRGDQTKTSSQANQLTTNRQPTTYQAHQPQRPPNNPHNKCWQLRLIANQPANQQTATKPTQPPGSNPTNYPAGQLTNRLISQPINHNTDWPNQSTPHSHSELSLLVWLVWLRLSVFGGFIGRLFVVAWMVGVLVGGLVERSVGWSVSCLGGFVIGWLPGWLLAGYDLCGRPCLSAVRCVATQTQNTNAATTNGDTNFDRVCGLAG